MEQKRIGIWIRVSTDFQVRDESPEHHEQRARYYAKSRDWNIVEVYRLDAISGKTVMEHPETQRMLADIRSGHITGLVFSKLARLARNTKELLEFAEIFRNEKADLVSLAEQIDTSTPAGRLFFTIISAMAQWEREEISSRVAASVPIRAEMGKPLGGQASFGYRWENKQLVIDEREAPVRRLVYEIFKECQRKKTTADKLNMLGYRTRNGSRFSDTTVDRLLRDTTARGIRLANYTKSMGEGKTWKVKPKEEWVQLPCPAVIPDELWLECNAVLDEQKRRRVKIGRLSENLLAGIVKCQCGIPMYVYANSKKFTCKACKNGILETDMNEIYQDNIKQYINSLSPQMLVDELEAEIRKEEELLAGSAKRLSKVQKKMDELVELRLSNELDREHFAKLYKPLEQQFSELNSSIPELEAKIDYRKIQLKSTDYVLNEAKSLVDKWDNMDFQQKRAIVETVTDCVTIREKTIDIALAYLPGSMHTSQRNITGVLMHLTPKCYCSQ